MTTRGYHNYRGRRQKKWIAAALILLILLALAFLAAQEYIVYDDEGKAHLELPFGRKNTSEPSDYTILDDVTIDYVDNGYAPHLQELQAQQLPANVLKLPPETALDGAAAKAVAVEVKRVNGAITYTTEVEVPDEVAVEQDDTMANLQTLLAENRYRIARMSVFCDSYFVRAYPDAALRIASGGLWYDAASMAWLDPSSPQVLVYITTLCQEYAKLGFDEILLDYFSYPVAGRLTSIAGLEDIDRIQVLTDFIKSLRANLPEDIAVSIVLRSQPTAEFGLSPEMLTENFDRIYLEDGVDADALRQQLPEHFDFDARLVPVVDAPAESGSYLLR